MSTVRLTGRPRRWPLTVIVVLLVLAVLFTVMSQFYVDLLWYREVRFSPAFWTVIRTKSLLGMVFGALFFVLLFVNLLIVRWLSPPTRILAPDQEVVERVRMSVEPYLRWLLPAGSAIIALFVGIGVAGQWQTFLLWRHSSGITFGSPEALFGRDPAFYVFTLPWLRFLQGWLFNSLVGVTFLAGVAHVLWGGIRPQAPMLADKVSPPVRAHLSVLLGLIMLAKAWGYYLGRFDLLTSKRGVVEGASYTDIHAQLPALTFLAIVAVICSVLFLVNIRVRLWSLPLIAVALLGVVSVVLGTAVPAFVQHFNVKPQEQQRELPYIKRNIEGTQRAFGIEPLASATQTAPSGTRPVLGPAQIAVQPYAADPTVTQSDVAQNAPTIENIRLWRPSAPQVLKENFESLQRIRQYYDFNDVDVDRYDLSGQQRVLMVSAREVSQTGIPNGTWQNSHLVFTHGYGAVASQVNTATAEGAPVFTLQGIPPVGEPTLAQQPRIYYGEINDVPFVITGTKTQELDYDGAATPQAYAGAGGIPMGNLLQRALFAWRYKDVNLLISDQISAQSKILIYRDIEERATKAVPFLKFDGDPYLAIVDGRMEWIWDAYTTTTQYPYSQSVDLFDATGSPTLTGEANYIRNSVKVVVDAYNGTITYYADLSDPIIHVWSEAFPGLFTPIDFRAPADTPATLEGLRSHFRYPENLFQIQASQYGRYHVTDPLVFYRNQDVWQVPDDPTFCANDPTNALCNETSPAVPPLNPFYQLIKLPGQTTEDFQLVIPFVPQGRQNMVSLMAADSDPADYGTTIAFTFPKDNATEGPAQVFSRINQDPGFSSTRTLLGQGGSTVLFGDFLVIPMGNSFLFVEPVYVRSSQATAVPELKRVVVVDGGTVGVGTTLAEALQNSLPGATTGGGNGNGGGGTVDQQVAQLLSQALQHFAAANAALTAGQLGTYQSELKLAQSLVKQANDLIAKAASSNTTTPGGTTTGTPSPSASTSASPSP
ncbi:MAG: UPF0182 family protein [Actinomycetota bacterium]|nr:UPF0182 family protein [Actinomycetota bacterium]